MADTIPITRGRSGSALNTKSLDSTDRAAGTYSINYSIWAATERDYTMWQRASMVPQHGMLVCLLLIVWTQFVDELSISQCYWSKLDGNGTITWADAHLTEKGVEQARIANRFWATEIAIQKIPVPENYYTSPLDRCLATAEITFSGLDLPSRKPFAPVVKEVSTWKSSY